MHNKQITIIVSNLTNCVQIIILVGLSIKNGGQTQNGDFKQAGKRNLPMH